MLTGKSLVVTGGTGSLGKVLIRRILSGELGKPKNVIVFSRDEAKQHAMRLQFQQRPQTSTDETIYDNFHWMLQFQIGDVRDYSAVNRVLRNADIVFNTAALKQVPTCEYFPFEAVQTNITGAENIIRAIREQRIPIETVVGVSTDKACKPVNVMGMTKALQERLFISANISCPETRFICVRYGNVLASRGSVIPLFRDQILNGQQLTITTPEMTRFLLSLNQAVDTIFAALDGAKAGEIYVPQIPAALITDIAHVLIGGRDIPIVFTGIRPGEKVHETLVSDEEAFRTVDRKGYYVVKPMLPEVQSDTDEKIVLTKEYSSADSLMSQQDLHELLKKHGLLIENALPSEEEYLA